MDGYCITGGIDRGRLADVILLEIEYHSRQDALEGLLVDADLGLRVVELDSLAAKVRGA